MVSLSFCFSCAGRRVRLTFFGLNRFVIGVRRLDNVASKIVDSVVRNLNRFFVSRKIISIRGRLDIIFLVGYIVEMSSGFVPKIFIIFSNILLGNHYRSVLGGVYQTYSQVVRHVKRIVKHFGWFLI